MNRIFCALLASLFMGSIALSTASCTTTIPSQSERIVVDEKALYVLELAYSGALATVEAGVDSGAITGKTASDVSAALVTAKTYIDAARRAYLVSDTVAAGFAVTEAYNAIGSLKAILKGTS